MSREPENQVIRINKQLCDFSNDGRFLALAFQSNLIIKNTGTFDTFQSFLFNDVIEYLEWSPNSHYVLSANLKNGIVKIFSLYYPEWKFSITTGSAGLEYVTWCLDSTHIITVADFKIQLTVWPLENRNITHIQNLKSSVNNTLAFSPNGKFLAVITTDEGKDSVELYKTCQWKLSRKLLCDRLSSIDGVSWSPNSELLCIWCSISSQSKLIVYSILSESHVGIFSPDEERNKYRDAGINICGIESVKWMPSGQILAVAGHNEVIVLLNFLTWSPIQQLSLDPVLEENDYVNKVYKECTVKNTNSSKSCASKQQHILEKMNYGSLNVPITKKNSGEPVVSIIDIFEFSSCGRYLAVRHQIYPTVLWIWHILTNVIDLLVLQNDISGVRWDFHNSNLMIFTESTHMFAWSPDKASCIATPNGMIVLDAVWHPSNHFLLLRGYNKATIYHIDNN